MAVGLSLLAKAFAKLRTCALKRLHHRNVSDVHLTTCAFSRIMDRGSLLRLGLGYYP